MPDVHALRHFLERPAPCPALRYPRMLLCRDRLQPVLRFQILVPVLVGGLQQFHADILPPLLYGVRQAEAVLYACRVMVQAEDDRVGLGAVLQRLEHGVCRYAV